MKNSNILTYIEWRQYCIERHDVAANQKYDRTLPYSKHLDYVYDQYRKFEYLLDSKNKQIVEKAIYGHDLIEDARVTYNDILELAGPEVADIVYACTEEKGRNRKERHSGNYYTELAKNKLAVFVKLCDIIANVKYSFLTNSSMFAKYKEEHELTKMYLNVPEYKDMINYLIQIFRIIP